MYTVQIVVFYRPQTKFAKVMFSQVSVCPGGILYPEGGGPLSDGRSLSSWETPMYGYVRAVHILLECILPILYFGRNIFAPGIHCRLCFRVVFSFWKNKKAFQYDVYRPSV